jgi:LacI family transcriptional regulator
VGIDYERGARLAMDHLLELGHQDVGFIGFANSKKYNVYWETLEARGLRYQPRYVQFLESASLAPGIIAGYQSMQKLIGGGRLPTAMLITNDYVALGAMDALSVAGIGVPSQMSVVGFDDFAQPAVGLTSVRADLVELGRIAVRSLFEPARRQNGEAGIVLPVELKVRGTTAPPAIPEPNVAPSLHVK